MGEKVQTGLWWAWLTEYPDEGSVVVAGDDEAAARKLGAELLAEGDESGITVEVCDPHALKAEMVRWLLDRHTEQSAQLGTDTHTYAGINEDMLREIRSITDAAGHDGVPFLDDAVRNIRIERDRARTFAATMERLGFSLREDDQRPEGAPRFTASIPGAGRGDGRTAEEAIDKLRARLTENAGPVHVVQARAAEAQRIADAMNGGLIDIWTDLGKPDIGPESFIEALVAACRRAIAATQQRAAWADVFAAELTRRCARDPDEVARAEAMHGQLVATMPEWEQANCANKAERVARRRSSERGVGRGFDRPHTEWTEGDRD